MITQSRTIEIKRSQIRLNPFNPKRHPEEAIKLQQRNFKKVGYLGGVSWNERTGNLLDGHRRVLAMDALNKYDGTEATDYVIKVEATNMDEKTEKEQMTYMAVGNTKADMDLIAEYITDISTKDIGLTETEINSLLKYSEVDAQTENMTPAAVETFFDFIPSPTVQAKGTENLTPEERKAIVKEARQVQNDNTANYSAVVDLKITVSFSSEEEKVVFCEMLGLESDTEYVKGGDILNLIQ